MDLVAEQKWTKGDLFTIRRKVFRNETPKPGEDSYKKKTRGLPHRHCTFHRSKLRAEVMHPLYGENYWLTYRRKYCRITESRIGRLGHFSKVFAVVSDNAANMKKSLVVLKLRHVPCFAHLIHLLVNDSLAKVKGFSAIRFVCLFICRSLTNNIRNTFISSFAQYNDGKYFKININSYSKHTYFPGSTSHITALVACWCRQVMAQTV